MSKATGYADDLAHIHDTGFGDFVRRSAKGLLETLHNCGVDEGLVVDLGYGSGIWAERLVKAGYEVIGVDISPSFINIARDRVPDAVFHVDSFLHFEFQKCCAATALGEVLNYRFDLRNGLPALRRLFKRVYGALGCGGVFISDVAEPDRN